MKKIIIAIISLLLALVMLAGCGDCGGCAKSDTNDDSDDKEKEALVLYETENFKIDDAMATYMYYNTYQIYYSYYGEYLQYFGIDIAGEVTSSAKTILARCEAAKAEGYELTDDEIALIKEEAEEEYKKYSLDVDNRLKLSAQAPTTPEDDYFNDEISECESVTNSPYDGYDFVFSGIQLESGGQIQVGPGVQVEVGSGVQVVIPIGTDPHNTWLEVETLPSVIIQQGSVKITNITKSDIENVLKLKALANKIYTDKESAFTDSTINDKNRLDKYYDENKEDFIKGSYLEANVIDDLYRTKIEAAETETDFRMIFTEYYLDRFLLGDYNAEATTTVSSLDDSIYATVEAIVNFYLHDIETYGVALEEVDDINDINVSKETFASIYAQYMSDGDNVTDEMLEILAELMYETCRKADARFSTYEDVTITRDANVANKGFHSWFFDGERKENDIYSDPDSISVYFVTEPAVRETYTTKSVGHILVEVDDMANENAKNEAKAKAEDILSTFLSGERTKSSFETLAKKNTADSGVFYENFTKGKMVTAFESWAYDESRRPGDTGIVETEYGYHVMYFVGDGLEAWVATALNGLLDEDLERWDKEVYLTYPVTVNQKNIDKVFGTNK